MSAQPTPTPTPPTTPEPTPADAPDLTTPTLIAGGVGLTIVLLVVVATSPPALGDRLIPTLLTLTPALVAFMTYLIMQRLNGVAAVTQGTHAAVNGQMDQFRATLLQAAESAARVALAAAEQRVTDALAAGEVKGHAAGLAAGRAEAVTALAAAIAPAALAAASDTPSAPADEATP